MVFANDGHVIRIEAAPDENLVACLVVWKTQIAKSSVEAVRMVKRQFNSTPGTAQDGVRYEVTWHPVMLLQSPFSSSPTGAAGSSLNGPHSAQQHARRALGRNR